MKEKLIWFVLVILIGGMITAGSAWIFYRQEVKAEALTVYGSVPPFSLTERSGRNITLDTLKGQIWVADFIFTNCAGTCPMMSSRMKELQDALENSPEVRLVSISVDPNRDTPEALSSYADRYGADPNRWLFLTGDEKRIHDLAKQGFMLGVESGDSENPILHSEKLVLVDRRSQIRGYFDSANPEERKRLMNAIRFIKAEN